MRETHYGEYDYNDDFDEPKELTALKIIARILLIAFILALTFYGGFLYRGL